MSHAVCLGLGLDTAPSIEATARHLELLCDSVELHIGSTLPVEQILYDRIRRSGPDEALVVHLIGDGRLRAGQIEVSAAPGLDLGLLSSKGAALLWLLDLRSSSEWGAPRSALVAQRYGNGWLLVGHTSGVMPEECRLSAVAAVLLAGLANQAANPLDLHPTAAGVPTRALAAEIRTGLNDAAERHEIPFADYTVTAPASGQVRQSDTAFFPHRAPEEDRAEVGPNSEFLLRNVRVLLAVGRGEGMPFAVLRECFIQRRLDLGRFRSALAVPERTSR